MRFHLSLLLSLSCLALISCAESAPEALKCKYEIQPHETPRFTTDSNDLNIPFDQEKLVQFMNINPSQSECFARQYAAVRIYRVPYTTDSGQLHTLATAPQKAVTLWNNFMTSSGFEIRGLTSFRYQPGEEEKIVESYILLRTDATAWHLWHEFSHFIIGTARAKSHDHSLHIAEKNKLDQLKGEILYTTLTPEVFSEKLEKYLNDNFEYIQKRFIDEILIESTLLNITSQGQYNVSQEEVLHAHGFIQTFSFDMNMYVIDLKNTLAQINNHPLTTDEQKNHLQNYTENLNQHISRVDQMVISATAPGRQTTLPF